MLVKAKGRLSEMNTEPGTRWENEEGEVTVLVAV